MRLKRLDDCLIDKVFGWLIDEENAKWLDFGGSLPEVTRPLLQYMCLKNTNRIRIYTDDYQDDPLGVVVLSKKLIDVFVRL